ncbi:DEAD/DEAH box helicase [Frateuria aurantia]|uniref:Helicase family protein with metal-binding cysteine cluster n=1 Tax=Frateuria aurantia (strain ATCC 33424 / DSM 6220 / KCTC 2777 / LMG 1558 / NBRC 3245 / NCIMB 13370) TaxID=767434 RepID=H8L0K1_FRAAD|nr:DEAD/DEAH box helicase [Frateuria aurantia]AFC84627.1 helicase family protein with metal-binding cysteine cluster [Frateuria aurantia DSM 6220]
MNAASRPAPAERRHDSHDSHDSQSLATRLRRRYADRITGVLDLPAREGRHAPLPAALPPKLRTALEQRGINQLYSHQAEAWAAAVAGRHLAVATPTASGKSLCYTLPVLSAAMQEQAKSLYLFPTKALAQDQVAELLELNRAGDLGVKAFTFDGDTPGDARQAVRLHGDIVVSNPDMLHQAILPHHTKWAGFFENLRYVVIDEVHTYRGVFGSHVVNLLRRLKRICAFYGSTPQFILCSATIGNPVEHAGNLIEAPVSAITESGAPCGPRQVLLWNPPVINPDLGLRASARSQSNRIARAAIRAGLKTLIFAQSRTMVEVLTKYLKDVFDHDPRLPPRIRAYRGGYLPGDRREAEREMRAGRVDGIVSTSALELGVDIGSLDLVILNGYPGSIAACWQRIGRAGRRRQASLGVLVAGSDPLDQYLVRHPEFFAQAPPEQARVAPDQPLILLDHIRCAAFELGFRKGDRLGPVEVAPWLELLEEDGVLHRENERWEWIADSYPAHAVSLRSVADGNFVVVDRTGGRQTIIAEVDYSAAAMTLYEGAIHMVQSTPYQVERLDWEGRKAYVRRTHVDYYTDAIDHTRLKPLDCFGHAPCGAGQTRHGEVHVVRRISGYKKIRYYSHENIGYGPINLPDQELHTTAVWWQLPPGMLALHFDHRQQAMDGFLGAAYALHIVATVAVMAEGRDLQKSVGNGDGTWSATADADGRAHLQDAGGSQLPPETLLDFSPTVFLYDAFPGGIGLSAPLYQRSHELLGQAVGLIERCNCLAGCPGCVGPILADAEQTATNTPRELARRVLQLMVA